MKRIIFHFLFCLLNFYSNNGFQKKKNYSFYFFRFLFEPESETYKLYQKRVTDLVEARRRAEADGHLMTFSIKGETFS